MRTVYAILLLLFLIIVLIFAVQNLAVMDISFLGQTISLPKAAVIVASYLLGMVSGYSVLAFIRRGLHDVRELREPR